MTISGVRTVEQDIDAIWYCAMVLEMVGVWVKRFYEDWTPNSWDTKQLGTNLVRFSPRTN